MDNLISGKEALIALANGDQVEYRVDDFSNDWNCAKSLKASEISSGMVEIFDSASDKNPKYYDAYFRIKPRTININSKEYPKPLTAVWNNMARTAIELDFNSEDDAKRFEKMFNNEFIHYV